MKIAVVGSGAAAAGVLAGLKQWGSRGLDITVYDVGRRFDEPADSAAEQAIEGEFYQSVYRELRDRHGVTFPPPKSHFGQTLPKFPVADKPRLWKSENRGGLTAIWGGGMFPFSNRELRNWPVSAEELEPYYELLAEKVGVCGESDALSDYFERDYVNRPPLQTSGVIRRLSDSVNAGNAAADAEWDVVAGSTRLALETRPGLERSCRYTGECMLGCPYDSIWSAGLDIDAFEREGFMRTVDARVVAWEGKRLTIERGESVETTEPYDRIYVAGGCIGSTEIAMRSLGIEEGPEMEDNAVFSFPIFYLGGSATDRADSYFSLCNLSLGGIPRDPDEAFAQFSVYPFFDHMWRYYAPRPLWRLGSMFGRQTRWRVLLGRVFLAGSANRRFGFRLRGEGLQVEARPKPDDRHLIDGVMAALRQSLAGSPFWIPPVRPPSHGTSSHYSGTFPYGLGRFAEVSRSGKVAPGVYLADATTFNDLPSISPTFTIMANAARTAHESLEDG